MVHGKCVDVERSRFEGGWDGENRSFELLADRDEAE